MVNEELGLSEVSLDSPNGKVYIIRVLIEYLFSHIFGEDNALEHSSSYHVLGHGVQCFPNE